MTNTTIGVFPNTEAADRAYERLKKSGVPNDQISIILRDTKVVGTETTGTKLENVTQGAVSGVATGTVVGAVLGLLAGLTAITIPGVGPLLVGGPIAASLGLTGTAATAVTGAVTGGLAGGLVGSLVGLGIPEEKARVFEERVKEGGVLLAIKHTETSDYHTLLQQEGAEEVTTYKAP